MPLKSQNSPNRFFKYFMLSLIVFSIINVFLSVKEIELPYSEFNKYLKQGIIRSVVLKGDVLTGEFKTKIKGNERFSTIKVDKNLAEEFEKNKVSFRRVPDSKGLDFFFSFIFPIFIGWTIWRFLTRNSAGKDRRITPGFLSIGKSRAKVYVEQGSKTTFRDVAGADEALEELKEVIDFLKNSEKIKQLGGKMPKGVLLVGPPGTGKTLIAKAVAGEANVPFFSTNGAEFVEMFVGVGASRVRDLFEQAKASAPCIVFIDELDALGKVRHLSPVSGNDEKEQTLNQLLVEMDGFDTTAGIIVLAATNRPEIIDPALLRAGRFDRQVMIDKPDKKGRVEILNIHVKKVKLSSQVNLEEIAALTPGFSGADLANLVNEAALIATRENAEHINVQHLTNAIERMVAGLQKKNRLLNEFERTVVAHHEMGHALAGRFFKKEDPIHKVSIIPRGIGSLGYTIQRPTEDRYLMTKEELDDKMTVLMAGRAAEALIFSHQSTGSADDLIKASNVAREMVMKYGMSPDLGFVSYEEPPLAIYHVEGAMKPATFSDKTAEEIDHEIKRMCLEAFNRAYNFLEHNRELLERAAQQLLKTETLTEAELNPFFDQIKGPPDHYNTDLHRSRRSADNARVL